MIPIWIVYGIIIGIFGYVIDTEKSVDTLISGVLLGLAGALQGYLIGNVFSTFPDAAHLPSPLVFSFITAFLLLTLGKITRKAF